MNSYDELKQISRIVTQNGNTTIKIRICDQNNELRFKLKNKRNIDRKTLNLIGWQNIDIYQNLVITYLFDIEINSQLEKDQFKLPSIN